MSTEFTSLPNWLRGSDSRRPLQASSQVSTVETPAGGAAQDADVSPTLNPTGAHWSRVASVLLALVAAVVLSATAAQGQAGSANLFDTTDGAQRWQQRVITVDGSRVAGMGVDVRDVLDAWTVAGLEFVEVAPGAPADVVMWRTSFAIPVAGRATRELDEAGAVVGCKLEVDATRPVDGFNAVIVAHEFGHCLGLGHADEQGEPSLMAWEVESPSFSLEVTPADVAALRALYR